MSYAGVLGGDSKYFKESNTAKFDEITKQLDSSNFKDKLVGMKKVIAVSLNGSDGIDFSHWRL